MEQRIFLIVTLNSHQTCFIMRLKKMTTFSMMKIRYSTRTGITLAKKPKPDFGSCIKAIELSKTKIKPKSKIHDLHS